MDVVLRYIYRFGFPYRYTSLVAVLLLGYLMGMWKKNIISKESKKKQKGFNHPKRGRNRAHRLIQDNPTLECRRETFLQNENRQTKKVCNGKWTHRHVHTEGSNIRSGRMSGAYSGNLKQTTSDKQRMEKEIW